MAMNRKGLSISDRQQEMLNELMEHTGITQESEIFRMALVDLHKRTLQNYAVLQAKRSERSQKKKTAAEKADERRAAKEQEKRDSEEYGQNLCDQLGGKAFKEGTNMICQWNTYDLVNPKHVIIGELEAPFEQLNEDHLSDQYQNGTKEQVEQAIAEGAEVE